MTHLTAYTSEYLACLNLQLEKPSYDYLSRICHAHLNTFPFENISKLLYYHNKNIEIPSLDSFVQNYRTNHFGGTCYTLNANLRKFLSNLGFDCYPIMLGKEHMGIIVMIDHERFYVDCGAAAPFFKPVPFERDFKNISSFGDDEVHLRPVDIEKHEYTYTRFTNGTQSGKVWHFHSRIKAELNDFTPALQKSFEENAPFMTILRCQRYQTDKQRSVSLVNNKFGIRDADGITTTTTLASVEEIQDVIANEFLLHNMPVGEAIDVLNTLNVNIFAKK